MNRKEFLHQAAALSLLTVIAPLCGECLSSCSSSPTAPSNVDFSVDLSTTAGQALQAVGGSLVRDGVIVARTGTNEFIAFQAACTHEGGTVQWSQANNNFRCPLHGATFSKSGSVTSGPAKQSLQSYQTSLTGTVLRVFS